MDDILKKINYLLKKTCYIIYPVLRLNEFYITAKKNNLLVNNIYFISRYFIAEIKNFDKNPN
jgi:hypothetical protein